MIFAIYERKGISRSPEHLSANEPSAATKEGELLDQLSDKGVSVSVCSILWISFPDSHIWKKYGGWVTLYSDLHDIIYYSYPIRHHITYAVEAASLNILMFQKFLLVTDTQTDTDAVVSVTESSLSLRAP